MTTVLTPLAIERLALAGTLASSRLITTGMGPVRSEAFAWPSDHQYRGPVIVAGLAGGLAPQVRPGDLVVADELRGAGAPIPVRSAQLLAGALRRLGLRVHVGPVHSSRSIVHGQRRAELSVTGALAVDQESAWLARRLIEHDPGTPLAVVRAVVDTADRPLLHPGTVLRGFRALRALRAAAPALESWSAASGEPREVVLAAPRAFCAGVERAIEVVERCLDRYGGPVYVRRQIVHNRQVVRELTERGAVFVQEADEVPRGAVLVLAAHGVSPAVRRQAAARELTVIDATCPLVSKVHAEVRRFAQRGETVFLVGHRDHEEVEGTLGEAPDTVIVVEDVEQARTVQLPAGADPERVAYVTQTTLSRQDAEQVIGELGHRFPGLSAPSSEDICFATTNRQRAVQAIAAEVDLVLVLGSANSSNSRRLIEVAEQAGTPARLIDETAELDLAEIRGRPRIGLTAGASAPPELVNQLIDNLAGLGPLAVREHRVAEEHVTFSLPPGVS
jgi:4-hydroxy-3-methylbut-2-enyl diphosphate reductase